MFHYLIKDMQWILSNYKFYNFQMIVTWKLREMQNLRNIKYQTKCTSSEVVDKERLRSQRLDERISQWNHRYVQIHYVTAVIVMKAFRSVNLKFISYVISVTELWLLFQSFISKLCLLFFIKCFTGESILTFSKMK